MRTERRTITRRETGAETRSRSGQERGLVRHQGASAHPHRRSGSSSYRARASIATGLLGACWDLVMLVMQQGDGHSQRTDPSTPVFPRIKRATFEGRFASLDARARVRPRPVGLFSSGRSRRRRYNARNPCQAAMYTTRKHSPMSACSRAFDASHCAVRHPLTATGN